jgi:hypothetical protein
LSLSKAKLSTGLYFSATIDKNKIAYNCKVGTIAPRFDPIINCKVNVVSVSREWPFRYRDRNLSIFWNSFVSYFIHIIINPLVVIFDILKAI